MRNCLSLALVAAFALVACSTEVGRSNPYDPDSENPAPGSIRGALIAPTLPSPEGLALALLQAGDEVSTTTAAADGRFVFDALSPGFYDLAVEAEGFQPLRVYRIEVVVGVAVELGALTLTPLVGTADASFIEGVARLGNVAADEPRHGGILVRVVGRPFQTLTGPTGTFAVEVPEGTYDLEFTFADYKTGNAANVEVPRATTVQLPDVVLLSTDPATIAGTVLRRTCAPVPTTELELPAVGALASALSTGQTGVADDAGTFAVTGLPAGVYTIRLALDGHDARELAGLQVRGAQLLQLEEPVVLPASKGSVSGRVRLTGEADHAGTVVELTGTGFLAVTSADGSFRIPGVCAGEGYELRAISPRQGFLPGSVSGLSVVGGEETRVAELTLPRQQGDFTLANGKDFANEQEISFTLRGPEGTTELRLSEDAALFQDPARANEGWESFPRSPATLRLTAGEGTKTVYAQVRGQGATSAVFVDAVVLDTTPPQGPSVLVEDGDGFSNDNDGVVLLTLLASEAPPLGADRASGLAKLRLMNVDVQAGEPAPPADPEAAEWLAVPEQPYQRTYEHALLRPGVEEEKALFVIFGDAAGNWSAPSSARVVLDRQAPDGVGVSIETSTPGFVNSSVVAVALAATDENPGVQVRLAPSVAFAGALYQPLPDPPVVTWFFSRGDGAKEVWVQYRDAAGNESQAISASTTLDTTPPTGVRLQIDEAPYAGTRDLGLTLAAQAAAELTVSLSPDFTDAAGQPEPWIPMTVAHALTLPDADGPYTVYAKYRDEAHNESIVLAAPVTLDRQPPAPPELDVVEGANVRAPIVTLRILALPGPQDAYEQRIDVVDVATGVTTTGSFEPYAAARSLLLPAPAGDKRIEVTLRDAAGNLAQSVATATVNFDPDPPLLTSLQLQSGAPFTASADVVLELVAAGADRMMVSTRADFFGADWRAFSDVVSVSLPPVDGPKTVFVRLADRAGNEAAGQASITLDRTPPAPIALTVASGALFTTGGGVDLELAGADALSGLFEVELSNDPGFTGATALPWGGGGTQSLPGWALLLGDGPRTVYARFRDAAGNTSTTSATIVVDAQPPTGLVSIEAGAPFALARAVTLTLSAPADTVRVSVTDGAALDCTSAVYEAFTSTRAHTLPSGEGEKQVTVCFQDQAGNTAIASDAIVLDTQNPTGALSIEGGVPFVGRRSVTLSLASTADVASMALVNASSLDCATASYEPWSPLRAFTLDPGDGPKNVSACFRDVAGRTASTSASITLDTSAPLISLQLDGGAPASLDEQIAVVVTASDAGAGLSRLQLSNDPGFASVIEAAWAGGATQSVPSFSLVPGDGARTVYAKVLDQAGNAAVAAATILVDRTAPGGTVVIDGGAAWARVPGVALTISAPADATHQAIVDGDTADCATASYEPFSSPRAHTLPPGDGRKAVTVCLRDAAGNTASATDEIVLDTVDPGGSLLVAGGAGSTTAREVTLVLSSAADVVQMALVNASTLDCASATFEPFAPTKAWQLSAGDGDKSVSVCFRDAAGRTSVTTDSILLDATSPSGTVQVDAGAVYSRDSRVDLLLAATDAGAGLVQVELSNDAAIASATVHAWPAGQPSLAVNGWDLTPGEGARTVYARFQDGAGNRTIVSATVVVDGTAPAAALVIAAGASSTQAAAVTLTLTAGDASQMSIVDGATQNCATASWVAFQGSVAWNLPGADGNKSVTACVRDAAGNVASATDAILLDTQNPAGTIAIEGPAAATATRAVVLTLTAPADTTQAAFANGAVLDCASATYESFAPQRSWTLDATEGLRTVSVCFKDGAGRTALTSDTILLDTSAPTGSVAIDGGVAFSTDSTVALTLTAADARTSVTTAELANDPSFVGATTVAWAGPGTQSVPAFALLAGDGARTVYVRYTDAVGNRTVASATITVDTGAIGVAMAIQGGASYATSTSVTISLTAPADVALVSLAEAATLDCSTAVYEAFAATKARTLSAGDGLKTWVACFKDAAGNTATASDSIALDTQNPAGTVVIAGGAAATATREVSLALTAPADAAEMAIANAASLDCSTATFEPFAPTKAWTLPAVDGLQNVSVCFRDLARRTASTLDAITLDRAAPTASVAIDAGATYSLDSTVALVVTAADPLSGLATLELSNDPAFTSVISQAWGGGATQSVPAFALLADSGVRTVYARLTDVAGNRTTVSRSITVDLAAPVGTLAINAGASYATSANLTLDLTASADVTQVAIAQAATLDCATAVYEGWASQKNRTASVGDGTKTFTVCFKDAAGNTSSATDAISLDTTPPSGTLVIDGAAAFTASTAVSLAITAPADTVQLSLSNGAVDCATAVYEPFVAQRAWTLTSGDVLKTVTICFKDAAGLTAFTSDTITLDTTPPAGTLSLAGGASFATNALVPVDLTWPLGTDGYALGDGALDCSTALYTSVLVSSTGTSTTRLLPAGDGSKTVVACLRDPIGNTAQTSDTVVVDTQAPAGTVLLAAGAPYALSTTVLATLAAPGDTTQMSVVETASLNCATALYEGFTTTKSIVLGGQGARTVSVCFKDAAGLTSSASDAITVDSVAPTGSLVIANAATHTPTAAVDLTLTASADVTQLALVNGGAIDCATAAYEAFTSFRGWALSAGEGGKTITGCLRDAAGNTVVITDGINLDTVSPSGATVAINVGATFTTSRNVTLDLTTPEAVTVALRNESLDCTTATYVAYSTPLPWTLADADGPRTVVVCFRDAAGWLVSKSATITLDRVAPSGTVAIDAGAAYTRDDLVDLTLSAPADTTHVAIANGTIDCATASYVGYVPTWSGWDLDPANNVANDGSRTVRVCYRDGALSTSATSATIILDRVNPSGTLSVAGGATHVRTRDVSIDLTSVSIDVDAMAIAEGALDCASAVYAAFAPSTQLTLSNSDAPKSLLVCLRDRAGRTVQLPGSVTLDRVPPSGTLTIAGGAAWVTSATVAVAGTSADATRYALANESIDCTAASYTAFAASFSVPGFSLQPADGLRTVRACLLDAAGNSAVVSDEVSLDRAAPTAPIVSINAGATDTSDATVTLTISATDNLGVTEMYVSRNGTFADGVWELFSATKTWDLNGAAANLTETRAAHVRVRDAALTQSASGNDTIVVDYDNPVLSSVVLQGGAARTAIPTVNVNWTATDTAPGSLAELRISEDANFVGAVWETYAAPPRSFTLSAGSGTKTVYVQVRDRAGRLSSAQSDQIILDATPPAVPSVTIAAGATDTSDATVQLTIAASDDLGVAEMYLSRDGTFADGVWELFSTTKSWDLNGGSPNVTETRSVFLKVRDAALNESAGVRDWIVVDYDNPTLGAPSIQAAAPTTTSTAVSVDFTATDVVPGAVIEQRLSEDPAMAGASWEPFTSPRTFTLSSANGSKTIYVQLRDRAGRVSTIRSDSITLDTQPPSLLGLALSDPSPAVAGFTNQSTVWAVVSASDNLSVGAGLQFALANAAALDCSTATYSYDFTGCGTAPCSMTVAFDLLPIAGNNAVQACARDAAGNVTPFSLNAGIVFDNQAPAGVSEVNVVAGSRQLEVSWVGVGDTGAAGVAGYLVEYRVATSPTWIPLAEVGGTETVITGLENRTEYLVHVAAVDRAGNVGNFSLSQQAVPGFRYAMGAASLGDRKFERPRLTYSDGDLYLVGPTTNGGSDNITVWRCRVAEADCRNPFFWTQVNLLPTYDVSAVDSALPIVVTHDRLAVFAIENNGVNDVPVAFVCNRSTGCDGWWEWTRLELETLGAANWARHISATVTGSRLAVAYSYTVAPNDHRPRIATCPLTSDCSVIGSWSKGTVAMGTAPFSASDPLALVTDEQALWLATTRPNGELMLSRCAGTNDCNADGDWAAPYALDGVDDGSQRGNAAELTMTRDYLYAVYKADANFNDRFSIRRCATSSSCDTATDWSAPVELTATNESNDSERVTVVYGGGALHATWNAPQLGWIYYATCATPDAADGSDCTVAANWRKMSIDRNVLLGTRPSVVAYDSNVAVVWLDDLDRLKFAVPNVTSPLLFGAGPAAGVGTAKLVAEWSPLFDVSGYEHLYDTDLVGNFANRSELGDSLMRRNDLTLTAGTNYWTSLRAYDAEGQLSDAAPVIEVRPLRTSSNVGASIGQLDGSTDSTTPASTWAARRYASTVQGTRLMQAWSDTGADLWFAHCDAGSLDCTSGPSWTALEIGNTAQGIHVGGVAATATTAYVAATNSIGEAWMYWCTLSSGCESLPDWSSVQITTNGVDAIQADAQIALNASRVYIATRVTLTGEVLLHHCAIGGNCALIANWNRNVSTISAAVEYRGHSLAVGPSYVAVLQQDGASLRFSRCWTGINCDAAADFTAPIALSTPTGVDSVEHSARLDLSAGERPAFIVSAADRVYYASCPFHVASCSSTGRWAFTELDQVVVQTGEGTGPGILTDLRSVGERRVALWSSLDEVRIATCDRNCSSTDRWRAAPALRIVDLVEPSRNIRNLTVLSSGVEPSPRIGFSIAEGSNSRFYWDGALLPIE